jgi:8-oxo-dGTP pyrophosphatase MutT (NUDIX family)
MSDPKIIPLDAARFTTAEWSWPYAQDRRADIDAHFAARQAVTPELWNGRVLLLRDYAFAGRALTGSFFETDFAAFTHWRDLGCPEVEAFNCFAMGALRGSDGAYLLGIMARHTATPGRIYFPAGTPDPEDIQGNMVDIAANVLRETAEETGLTPADFAVEPGWTAVVIGPRIALMKVMQAREPAEAVRDRILQFLDSETQPELAGIHVVRERGDFRPEMPAFVTVFLDHVLPQEN